MIIPLSLYIHIPWCVKKCPYCDFNSHQAREQIPEMDYIHKLLEDLENTLPLIWGRRIQTIFFGGGTPSLLSPGALDYLLKQLHSRLCYSPDIEITLEANPGTVEQSKFVALREIGINRLSIGIQSFQDKKLHSLGRIHDGTEAKKSVEAAKLAGFSNLNLDLMFGLPTQTLDDALFDLKTAIAFQPTHISWYQLTVEPNTHFYQFPPTLPEEDYIWEIQQQGQALLTENHYQQYEISAYSQPERQCLHNRNYWEFGDYLGIGAGSHSKITDQSSMTVSRIWKIKHPKQYLSATDFIAGKKIIPLEELPLEFMLNALRLHESISYDLFEDRTGIPIKHLKASFQKAKEAGLLRFNKENFSTTSFGKRFLNDLLQIFSG